MSRISSNNRPSNFNHRSVNTIKLFSTLFSSQERDAFINKMIFTNFTNVFTIFFIGKSQFTFAVQLYNYPPPLLFSFK